jgi:hypothetical protein
MIESPLLQRMIAGVWQKVILANLKARFGPVPRDVSRILRGVLKERQLRKLVRCSVTCPDLEAFREALRSGVRPGDGFKPAGLVRVDHPVARERHSSAAGPAEKP